MENGFAGLPDHLHPSNLPHLHRDPMEELREENRRLRERADRLFDDYIDVSMALGIVTGVFPPFNEMTRKRGQARLDKLKADWIAKGNSAP